jgi:hypothetical protein
MQSFSKPAVVNKKNSTGKQCMIFENLIESRGFFYTTKGVDTAEIDQWSMAESRVSERKIRRF